VGKITFDPMLAIFAPDDYYILLYFDVETHVISAIRYIVFILSIFQWCHSPENSMEVTGQQ